VNLSDRAVSYLRTVVPVLWGSLIGLLVQSAAWLPAPVIAWLSGEAAVGVVTAGAIAAWYAVWRWAEPRIPDWLTRVVLGSAQAPAYGVLLGEVQWLEVDRLPDDITATEVEADTNAAGNDRTAFPYA
jgi:hypothetical protein